MPYRGMRQDASYRKYQAYCKQKNTDSLPESVFFVCQNRIPLTLAGGRPASSSAFMKSMYGATWRKKRL